MTGSLSLVFQFAGNPHGVLGNELCLRNVLGNHIDVDLGNCVHSRDVLGNRVDVDLGNHAHSRDVLGNYGSYVDY